MITKNNEPSKSKQKFTNRTVKTSITAAFLTVFLVSCNSSANESQILSNNVSIDSIPSVISQNDSLDIIVKSIIDIAANDFYKNQQPLPTKFRNVQIKYNIKPNNEILYFLCGQFASEGNPKNDEWIHFTTIKNSEYEQWIGPSGLTYCENSKEIPYSKTNLSTDLEKKLLSIKNN
jgi:hypothetical protein